MRPLLDAVETVLQRHPGPALRLRRLPEQLRRDGHPVPPDTQLRRLLGRAPSRFRLLSLWTGMDQDSSGESRELWVALAQAPGETGFVSDSPGPAGWRLRESVRWMAGRVDPRSSSAVSRWVRLSLAEERTRLRMGRTVA